jgi:hypothetical protein
MAETFIDGITHCIINSDDGGSDAVKIAEVITAANAAGIPLPAGYSDTVSDLAVTGAFMGMDLNCVFIPDLNCIFIPYPNCIFIPSFGIAT